MKQEFENLIGKEVSDKDYEVIDRGQVVDPMPFIQAKLS